MSESPRSTEPLLPLNRVSERVSAARVVEIQQREASGRGRRGWLARRFGVETAEELRRGAEQNTLARSEPARINKFLNPALYERARALPSAGDPAPPKPSSPPTELWVPNTPTLQKRSIRRARPQLMRAISPERPQLPDPLQPAQLCERYAWRGAAAELTRAGYLLQRSQARATDRRERMFPIWLCLAEEVLRGDRQWLALPDWNNRLISALPRGSRAVFYGRPARDDKREQPIALGAADVFDAADLQLNSHPELWSSLRLTAQERESMEMLVRAWGGRAKLVWFCNPTRLRISAPTQAGLPLKDTLGAALWGAALSDLSAEKFKPLLDQLDLADAKWVEEHSGAYPPREPSAPTPPEVLVGIRDARALAATGDLRGRQCLQRYGGARAAEELLHKLRHQARERVSQIGGDEEEL